MNEVGVSDEARIFSGAAPGYVVVIVSRWEAELSPVAVVVMVGVPAVVSP